MGSCFIFGPSFPFFFLLIYKLKDSFELLVTHLGLSQDSVLFSCIPPGIVILAGGFMGLYQ